VRIRLFSWLRRHWKKLAACFLSGVVAVNLLAANHARSFLIYTPSGDGPPQPESLSTLGKFGVPLSGVSVPRPINSADPSSVGLAFAAHRIEIGSDWLEVWHVPAAGASRGIVLLFPGYSAAKESLLPESGTFHRMGYDVLLVDFRGAGGSSGSDTTLGIREAEDVAAVAEFAAERWPGPPVIPFGRSMGAAAILRAVGRLGISPAAAIVECPFDRMLNAVRNRFIAMAVPSFPGAELLVFWGGRRLGFDGFSHNPADDAATVLCPTLVLAGSDDTRATPSQVRAVYDRLPGDKHWHLFEGTGHEAFRQGAPADWDREVEAFLGRYLR
jgi:alpha-beta hydrolase superfamily lysophospholipase